MKLTHSTSLIGFLLFLSILSPTKSSSAATQPEANGDIPSTIEDRMNRITDALRERGDQLDSDLDSDQNSPENATLIAQFRNTFRNGGSGFANSGFANGSGFANRSGFANEGSGFANGGFANSGGGFANGGSGFANGGNGFRNSPGFFNYRV